MMYIVRLFQGRVTRETLFGFTLFYMLFHIALAFLNVFAVPKSLSYYFNLTEAILIAMLLFLWLSLTVRRWHDLGSSGWLTLLTFVPLLNIAIGLYLLFQKGQAIKNKYGDPATSASFLDNLFNKSSRK